MAKQNTVVAVGQTLSYEAGLLSKVIDPEGSKVAKAFKTALKDKKRVKAFLSGLVDEKLLVS
jgi:hypothetical protein